MINTASIPAPVEDVQGDQRWMSLHQKYLKDCKLYEPNVVLLGDSLVQQMQNAPVWKQFFEPLHCLNFGISGDKTENVLWRIENGELDFETNPKILVLLIGTNNHNNTADQIAEAILTIVQNIRRKLKNTYILVLAIPPRGHQINILREKITRINNLVEEAIRIEAKVDPLLIYISCSVHDFVNGSDGTISPNDMYDFMHFTNEGYRKFCEPIIEEINQILFTCNN